MSNYMIIPMVLVISLVTAAIVAFAVYRIDKNAARKDSRK